MSEEVKYKEKDYFYVKRDYIDDDDLGTYPIDINNINKIAFIATTLEPMPAENEIEGYFQALNLYYQSFNSLRDSYLKLISGQQGRDILSMALKLTLYEQKIRKKGIRTLDELKTYNNYASELQNLIALSQENYEIVQTLKKTDK